MHHVISSTLTPAAVLSIDCRDVSPKSSTSDEPAALINTLTSCMSAPTAGVLNVRVPPASSMR